MSEARRLLGARGEALAAEWYRAAGYEVLDRNWRAPAGEIDLVVRRGTTVVVCEVKARTTLAFGIPAEAVTSAKRARLRRLAAEWLSSHRVHAAHVRFDVASVLGDHVEIVPDAW
ncbi:MAG TPA: YraN family protein [Acidimicrobiales bacterium]|nr:YraN family protein [Acidimicrobiales bacterium]